MMLKKIFKHSCLIVLGVLVSFSANYYLIKQNFKSTEVVYPKINLSLISSLNQNINKLSLAFNNLIIYDNLKEFEEEKRQNLTTKKYIAAKKPSPKVIRKDATFHYKKVTTKMALKNSKIKAAKISVKKMEKINSQLKDSINLPTHKGIELYAFEIEKEIKSINMAALWEKTQIQIANIKEMKKSKEDRISTALAATEKSPSQMTTQKEAQQKELVQEDNLNSSREHTITDHEDQSEFVALDYSEVAKTPSLDEKSLPTEFNVSKVEEFQKPEGSNIKETQVQIDEVVATASNSVNNDELVMFDINEAQKEVKKSKAKVVVAKPKRAQKKEESNDLVVYEFTDKKNEYAVCAEGENKKTYSTSLSISPKLVHIGSSKTTKLENFEVKFKDDLYNGYYSSGSDPLVIAADLNGVMNIRRATIFSRDIMPTTTDLAFELEPVVINLPTISRDSFDHLVRTENLRAQGGQILVELDDMTESVEIMQDTYVEKKLYLDKNYRVVNRGDSEYSYVLFVGVAPGNTILTYKTWRNEITSKIIHVTSDEIFYDFNLYIEESGDQFEICEESVLSKKPTQFYINSNDIEPFGFNAKVNNLGLNTVGLDRVVYPLGTRKYYSLRSADESIFIGRFEDEQVVIPSPVYRSFVLENFGLRSLGNQCIVQVNLKKPAMNIQFEGESSKGYMRVDKLLLDRDGQFYEDFSETTQKIFFLGERQGIINLKVDYADGSHDYLMTYCSDATYLVEQL